GEQKAPANEQRMHPFMSKCDEGRVNLAVRADVQGSSFQPHPGSSRLDVARYDPSDGTGRIDQDAQQRCLRQQYTQELQTLRGQLGNKKVDACSVASWLRNARDKTDPDRIFADGKDNRNGAAGSFGGQSRGVSCGHNHGNLAANQLLSEGW